jgi:hypothetical protein
VQCMQCPRSHKLVQTPWYKPANGVLNIPSIPPVQCNSSRPFVLTILGAKFTSSMRASGPRASAHSKLKRGLAPRVCHCELQCPFKFRVMNRRDGTLPRYLKHGPDLSDLTLIDGLTRMAA